MGSLFSGPKIPKEQKQLNQARLESERRRASEAKEQALAARVAGNNYGIRSLLGGGSRGGFA